ncbi:sulfotransferase domain-containing protein [Paraglaciecola agarilytica]|uniref:sulfotransferase domain-containing protein n=1 Tax=Paraglaciecola chathamensis TaxID=368405 RepID=UPI001C093728|nr:sulfotransferase domain-containing protein [Paraglaciecola agarilytica]MBU3019371.1 sulfotransferase domain-containing protein [Paraglaciecola agarilytica]
MNNFIWIASYPKSGNTYTRFVFANLINIQAKEYSNVDFYNLGKIMPEDGKNKLDEHWKYNEILPKLVKTHRLYSEVEYGYENRSIYIVRDPRDVMLSYYHYVSNRLQNGFSGPFNEFINHDKWGVRPLNKHYESWLDHADAVIRYEDLMNNPYVTFSKIAKALKLTIDFHDLSKSIRLSCPKRLRNIEDRDSRPNHGLNFKESYRFVRNASVSQWKTQLSNAESEKVMHLCSNLVRKYYE